MFEECNIGLNSRIVFLKKSIIASLSVLESDFSSEIWWIASCQSLATGSVNSDSRTAEARELIKPWIS